MEELRGVMEALSQIRVPQAQPEERELHALVEEALLRASLSFGHEVALAPRSRIDFLCGGIGIEVKKGRPPREALLRQCGKYLQSDRLTALVLLLPRQVWLPERLQGKPLRVVSLNRLWGVALP